MRLFTLLLFCGLIPATLHAQTKPKRAQPIEPPVAPQAISPAKPDERRVFEFQEDELPLVLRMLARQAGMNVILNENVRGRITLRVQDKTPREALDLVCEMKGLKMEENAGVFFISDPNASVVPHIDKGFNLAAIIDELLTPENVSAATKLYDAMLDIQARPETAKKVARARKQLLDALMAEGFSRDEAMKILLYSGTMELPDFKN